MKQAVVLAGGLGTRMLPATEQVPKALLDVAGRPFLGWLLPRLREAGFDEVLLCVGHLGHAIRAYVAASGGFGIEVRFADEGPRRRGTLGALVHAREALAERFVVTYGDAYLRLDAAELLGALDARPELLGAMAVWKNDGLLEASNAAVADGLVVRYDKGRGPGPPRLDHVDYGATALRRVALDDLPRGVELGLELLQARLAADGRLGAFAVPERFYEIGSAEGRDALEQHLRASSDGAPRELVT